jgi:hypothetical protein
VVVGDVDIVDAVGRGDVVVSSWNDELSTSTSGHMALARAIGGTRYRLADVAATPWQFRRGASAPLSAVTVVLLLEPDGQHLWSESRAKSSTS